MVTTTASPEFDLRTYVAAEATALSDGSTASPETTRVLVADGNATVRKILRHTFRSLDWELIEAEDGEQALRLVEARPRPHAMLLDLHLAKLDGFEVCRRLKSDLQLRLIPVVVMTSSDGHEEKMQALEAGADEFLSKPINRAELTVRLRSLARMHRFNQELIGAESVALALARAVASKDGYSSGHIEEVANYAAMFGESLGWDAAEVKILKYGAILHNVGKIAIPDAVLEKTEALTPRERRLVPAASARRVRHLRPAQAAETDAADHPPSQGTLGWDGLPRWLAGRGDPARRPDRGHCRRVQRTDQRSAVSPGQDASRGRGGAARSRPARRS